MVDVKSLSHLIILLLTFCFMMVKCSLESADEFIDNPIDIKRDTLSMQKRPSFFVGSRYGRSGSSSSSGSSLFATSKTRRLNVVPRNDRFFLSSRYGKRSEISTGTQLSNKPMPQQQRQQQQQQQQQQQYDDFITNHRAEQQLPSSSSSLLSSSLPPPYAYMSCIYTGLQNYYRCNSIDSMFNLKYSSINDNDNDVLATDTTGAALLNDDNNNDNNVNDNDTIDNDNDFNNHDGKK